MSDMAAQMRERMREDGIDLSGTVDDQLGGSPVEGTGGNQGGQNDGGNSSAGTQITDSRQGRPPESIPYSRFTEVNGRLQQLRPWEDVAALGISPDSAVRLANFEQAYQADPEGTVAAMVDQWDLPDAQKSALKALLKREQDGAPQDNGQNSDTTGQLPPEVKETLDYVRELRQREVSRDAEDRLGVVVRHWQQLDEQEGVKTPDRQRLLYIQSIAGSGHQFSTLEQLAEAARGQFLEDRDVTLGSAVNRGTGTSRSVSSGGLALPGEPLPAPKSMAEARKRIEADIAAGRLPDLSP